MALIFIALVKDFKDTLPYLVGNYIIVKLPCSKVGIGYIISLPLAKQTQGSTGVYIRNGVVLYGQRSRIVTLHVRNITFVKHLHVATGVLKSNNVIGYLIRRFKVTKGSYAIAIKDFEVAIA